MLGMEGVYQPHFTVGSLRPAQARGGGGGGAGSSVQDSGAGTLGQFLSRLYGTDYVAGVSVVKCSSSQHDFTLELPEGTFKKIQAAPSSNPYRTSDVRRASVSQNPWEILCSH